MAGWRSCGRRQGTRALEGIDGPDGKTVIDGPTAKSFNINFAALFGQVESARSRPGNLWCGDEEARELTEQLTRDAGYDPICAGPLTNSAMQEAFLPLVFAIAQEGGMGQFFYRMAPPGEL